MTARQSREGQRSSLLVLAERRLRRQGCDDNDCEFRRPTRARYERTLADTQRVLEAAGIEFINGGNRGSG
jgi:hypothetical protein